MNIIRTATIFSPYLPKYIARRRRPVTDFATSVTTCIRRRRISTDSFIPATGIVRPYRTKITTSPRCFSFDKTATLAEGSTPICLDRFSVRKNSTGSMPPKRARARSQRAGIDEKIKTLAGEILDHAFSGYRGVSNGRNPSLSEEPGLPKQRVGMKR